MVELKIRCALLHSEAKLPTLGSAYAAGWDLYAADDATIEPGVPCAIDTGVAFEIPVGYFGAVCQRSGLARKGIVSTYGVVDADYRGAVGVTLLTSSQWARILIQRGDRIAQLVIQPVPRVVMVECELSEMTRTERQNKGFGSTGVR